MAGPVAALEPATPGGAWAREHLATDIVGWLTTVTPDGQPQSSVISFMLDGDTLLVYSKPDAPKVRNIAANPRVAFHLQCGEYGKRRLTLEGIAAPDETATSEDAWSAYVAKHNEALRRWEMDPLETARAYSLLIRIRPTRIRAL